LLLIFFFIFLSILFSINYSRRAVGYQQLLHYDIKSDKNKNNFFSDTPFFLKLAFFLNSAM